MAAISADTSGSAPGEGAPGAIRVTADGPVTVGVGLQVSATDVDELSGDGVVLVHGDLQLAGCAFWDQRAL